MSQPKHLFRSPTGLLDFDTPKVMGIINLTPDSFYPKSRHMDISRVVDEVGLMIEDGVDIVDMGAVSTRPGSVEPTISEEIDRILAPSMAVRAAFPDLFLSIDTYRSEVLKACMDARFNLVNDISAGSLDPSFLKTVAESRLPYVLMHMRGTPKEMQQNPFYEDVVLDIMKKLDEQLHFCRSLGINEMVIDPGFGFGKTVQDNYTLLSHLDSFQIFNLPVLVGLSRKSMIYKPLKITSSEALHGTTALHMVALLNGAKILRVHDVKPAKQCVLLWQQLEAN